MPTMVRKVSSCLLAASLLILIGCARNVGWIVKPVPLKQKLCESVVRRDPGLLVTDKIALVDVDGLWLNRRPTGLLGPDENPVSLFAEKLDAAQADPNVRAVILRINSPGGGVTASDIMYKRLVQLRTDKGIPVVAIIQDVGASGAYYIACGADKIIAHPTSVVGSIGVIIQTVSLAGTMKMLGIEAKAITSGPRKDLASPLKPLDEKDIQILRGIVDEYYDRFVHVVDRGRAQLGIEQIKKLADGRVFTGRQAKDNGLVDDLGYLDDAIALAKKLSGAERVKVVMYHRPLGYRPNVYAAGAAPQVNMINVELGDLARLTQPQFLYLWTGATYRD